MIHANTPLTLLQQTTTSPPTTESFKRSHDIPMQRKDISPRRHPFRYFDTFNRIFQADGTSWHPERAKSLRTHQLRGKHYDIINHHSNSLDIRTNSSEAS